MNKYILYFSILSLFSIQKLLASRVDLLYYSRQRIIYHFVWLCYFSEISQMYLKGQIKIPTCAVSSYHCQCNFTQHIQTQGTGVWLWTAIKAWTTTNFSGKDGKGINIGRKFINRFDKLQETDVWWLSGNRKMLGFKICG